MQNVAKAQLACASEQQPTHSVVLYDLAPGAALVVVHHASSRVEPAEGAIDTTPARQRGSVVYD